MIFELYDLLVEKNNVYIFKLYLIFSAALDVLSFLTGRQFFQLVKRRFFRVRQGRSS